MTEFTTYYVKTACRHCNKEMIIEIKAKTPILAAFNSDGIGEIKENGKEEKQETENI